MTAPPPEPVVPRSCLVFRATAPPFPEALGVAERIEAAVFGRSFGETAQDLRGYYAGHLPQTAIVLAHDDGWAGMMRLGLPGPRESLSLEDAAAPPFDADVPGDLAGPGGAPVVLMDVLTAAIRRHFRSRRIFERMLVTAVAVAAENRCTHVVGILDLRVLTYLRRRRLAYRLHSGLHDYYGSTASGIASVEVAVLRRWIDAAVT